MALWQMKQKNAPAWVVAENGAQTSQKPSHVDASLASSQKGKIDWAQAVADYLPKPRKPEDPVHPASREKKLSILGATYPLNKSHTKKIMIGLYYDATQKLFLPMAQLTNADMSYNVYMDNAAWCSLQNHLDAVSDFFEAPHGGWAPPAITEGGVRISFAHSHGSRFVSFHNEFDNLTGKHFFKCGVTMQQKTFEGLRRAVVCADERFRRIGAVTMQVNNCKDYMLEALSSYIDVSSENENQCDDFVHDVLIKKYGNDIVQSLKKIFVNTHDTVFIKHYFDLIYLELAFLPQIFVSEMKQIIQNSNK